MPVTQKRLFVSGSPSPQQLTASTAVYYTVPQSTTTIVKQIILTNTTAAAKTVTVRLKPLGVTEASTHDILSAVSIAANETLSFNCSLVLTNNGSVASATTSDQITAFCSAATSVNMTINGVEES